MKFASIDIGSNAVRFLLSDVTESKGKSIFKKSELIRVPLRLGEDVCLSNRISRTKIKKLICIMKAVKNLISAFDVVSYKACATSAMREAKNAAEIIKQIRHQAKIKVEVIDGKTEAAIIYANHIEGKLDKRKSYLYFDIGGGSTELTLFSKGRYVTSQSFNIGAIRLLHKKINAEYWNHFRSWIRLETKNIKPLLAIGSGGNINKLYNMDRKKGNKALTYKRLKKLSDKIKSYSYEDRIKLLGLRSDRADVIVPASKIALTIMRTAKINEMLVPQIGLAEGIIHQLYEEKKNRKK